MFKRIVMMVLFLISFGVFSIPAGASSGESGEEGNEGNEGDEGNEGNEGNEGDEGEGSGEEETVPYFRFKQEIDKKKHYQEEYDKMQDRYEKLQTKIENMEDPEQIRETLNEEKQQIEQQRIKDKKTFELKVALLSEGADSKAIDDLIQVLNVENFNFDNETHELIDKENAIKKVKESKPWGFSSSSNGEEDLGGGGNPNTDDDKYREAEELAKKQTNQDTSKEQADKISNSFWNRNN